MKYVITLLALAAGLLWVSGASAWEPPGNCADADREIPGNRLTPCKLTFPEVLEDVTYEVKMVYPNCIELLSFALPGARPKEERELINVQGVGIRSQVVGGKGRGSELYRTITDLEVIEVGRDRFYAGGNVWNVASSVEGHSHFTGWAVHPPLEFIIGLWIGARSSLALANQEYRTYWAETPPTSLPDVSGMAELAHSCIALLAQEKQDREHADELARQEAESQARIRAQEDADRKAAEQAQREAETQARIAKEELAAALASKVKTAEIELIKTQTLETQLKHEEEVAGILRDIVRLRLSGQEDRARITNEYLGRLEQMASEVDVEASDVEARVQKYLDFNAQLLERIAEYQSAVESRLAQVEVSITEQTEQLAQIREEAEQTEPETAP